MMEAMQLGIERFNGGRYEEALRCFRRAFEAGERDPQLKCFMAHALNSLGRPRQAAAAFASLIHEAPRHLPAYAGLANLILQRGRIAGASQNLRRALRLAPDRKDGRGRLVEALRACAQAWRSEGDAASAEAALRKALALNPRDKGSRDLLVEALSQRAQSHLSEGELEPAEEALRAVLALEPRHAQARCSLVAVLRRRAEGFVTANEVKSAEKVLRELLVLEPSNEESRFELIKMLLSAGKLDEAERSLRRSLARNPRDEGSRTALIKVLWLSAQRCATAGELEKAERRLREALSIDPGNAQTRQRLIALIRPGVREHKSAGRRKAASALSRKILRIDPADARARMTLGDVLFSSGKVRRGRAVLAQALRLDRGTLEPIDRFKVLMKLGRYKAAVAAAERILDKGPRLVDIRCFWDPWEWDDRRPRSSRVSELRRFEAAIGPRARSPWLHYYRADLRGPEGLPEFERLAGFSAKRYGWMFFKAGTAALLEGRFETAAKWFKISLRRRPKDWRAHCFLGEAYLCLRRPRAAFQEMDRALRAAPDSEGAQIQAWRGAFDLWLGNYKKALARLNIACGAGAQCAFCWRAGALLKLGKPAQALKQLDLTLSRYPLDFEAYVWRGEAKRELGLYEEALEDLDEKTFKDPRRVAPVWLWALFNRSLAKLALGDREGAKTDFDAIPAFVVDHIRKRTGLERMEDILKAGLRLSRGFRRDEYRQAIWMA
ncbi:MAG: tetratricopeptide repeat protein [Elusimicrobia bacterium]|nr:tetratricopeptide repeat protein [Elusimicrobiota bacterium]